jgi:hypothetical protein
MMKVCVCVCVCVCTYVWHSITYIYTCVASAACVGKRRCRSVNRKRRNKELAFGLHREEEGRRCESIIIFACKDIQSVCTTIHIHIHIHNEWGGFQRPLLIANPPHSTLDAPARLMKFWVIPFSPWIDLHWMMHAHSIT